VIKINGINFDLADIEKDCWIRMLNGSLKSKDTMHNPVVANIENGIVSMRTVVLRNVDTKNKTILLHTDIRSGKWKGLKKNNTLSWLFYDAQSRFQIRVGGIAKLHHNDSIADEAWGRSSANSRKIYLGDEAPSEISDIPTSGLDAKFEFNNPTVEETEIGRKNFGVVVTKVNWVNWLWLSSTGHRRAKFKYDSELNLKGSWLVP
jgi:pyridoxamine 5'-phosphate oxidase